MRDPRRIDRLLEKLRIIWQVRDDLALVQVMNNIWNASHKWSVAFIYRGDEQWETALDQFILGLENGIEMLDGTILFLDRCWLVTKDELYED